MQNPENYKPWELYPHIWKTESNFWTWMRGSLRRSVWEKYPVKLEFKNEAVSLPPEGYTGRAKSGAICALSGVWEGKSKMEVDHIEGNVSLKSWEDVLPFVMHMVTTKETMQLVTKPAHKIKSYAERFGLTYEEADVKKAAIAWFKEHKGIHKQRDALVTMGIDSDLLSNSKTMKLALEDHLRTQMYPNQTKVQTML